jgi:hypothetical protein
MELVPYVQNRNNEDQTTSRCKVPGGGIAWVLLEPFHKDEQNE